MNIKYFTLLRILIWIIPIGIISVFAYNFFSLDGHFYLKYDFSQPSGFVSRFYSPDNVEIIKKDEDDYIKIFNSPVAFNLKVPTSFETAKVKLKFKTNNLEAFEFGVIEDQGKKNFRLNSIKSQTNEWQEQEIELNLKDIYYHPTDKLGFVILLPDEQELLITEMDFNLYRPNLWQTLKKKFNQAQN